MVLDSCARSRLSAARSLLASSCITISRRAFKLPQPLFRLLDELRQPLLCQLVV
jgi:hypothetical protein